MFLLWKRAPVALNNAQTVESGVRRCITPKKPAAALAYGSRWPEQSRKQRGSLLWQSEWQNDCWHTVINKAKLPRGDGHDAENVLQVNEWSTNAGFPFAVLWTEADRDETISAESLC